MAVLGSIDYLGFSFEFHTENDVFIYGNGSVQPVDVDQIWSDFRETQSFLDSQFASTHGFWNDVSRYEGTSQEDNITMSQSGGIFAGAGNDIINVDAIRGLGQHHVYAGSGNDTINLGFTIIDRKNGGDLLSHGHHVRGDTDGTINQGADIFRFRDLGNIRDGAVIVGRLADFDATRDYIYINDAPVTFDDLPAQIEGYSVRIVEYNGNFNNLAATPQQWILIDTGGGFLFYALEGVRVIQAIDDEIFNGGSNNNRQEEHFLTSLKYPNNLEVDTSDETAIANFFNSLPSVNFVDPQNTIPNGVDGLTGLSIVDSDRTDRNDGNEDDDLIQNIEEIILGTQNNDVIAAGLNNDSVESLDGQDTVYGGTGDDTIDGGGGNDHIIGGRGDDSFTGGAGADVFSFISGHGHDVISDFDASGGDIILFDDSPVMINDPNNGFTTLVQGDDLLLTFDMRTSVLIEGYSSGSVGDPTYNDVFGTIGDDRNDARILGTTGDDRLFDYDGRDEMLGRAGDDIFVMALDGDRDEIMDFADGKDLIDISSWGVTEYSMLNITQDGASVRVRHELEDIEIKFATATNLAADDFIFADGSIDPSQIDPDPSDNPTYNDVFGTIGDDRNDARILGTTGDDRLYDYDGRDEMLGREGDDIFVMALDGDRDEIMDFADGEDLIDISSWGVTNFSMLNITQDGASVRVRHELEDIEIKFATATNLAADDFIFADGPIDPSQIDPDPSDNPTYNDVFGTIGDDRNDARILGTTGDDRLYDYDGRDEMLGREGDDIFVMALDGDRDEIMDFTDGEDLIDISSWGITDFSMLNITQDGASARVRHELEDIEIKGFDFPYLSIEDFIFL